MRPDKGLQESLGNSIIKEEFPASDNVVPTETNIDKQNKELIIQGSIETTIDITLANCIKLALGNNPRIKAAMEDVFAANTRIAQAWSAYFPELTWQTSYSKNRQLELDDALQELFVFQYYVLGQIGLNQMLYDFGVTKNKVEIKKLSYKEYKASLTETINDVIYKTKDAYFNLLYSYDAQIVAEDSVEKYEKFYNNAKARFEVGLTTSYDVTLAQIELSSAKLQLIEADNNISLAVAKLNKEMGVNYITKYNVKEKLKYAPIKISMSEAFEIAKQVRPELKIADLKVEEANQTVNLAKKAYYPVLELEANYARGGRSINSNYGYMYGVFLNFPTVNIMLNKNQLKEFKSLYNRELANAQETKNSVYLEIQTAYLQLDTKKKQIPVSFLQVKNASSHYETAFGRYRVGAGSSLDVKDAQNSYRSTMLNYYKTLYEYNSAKAQLEKAIGKNIVGIEEEKYEIN